MLYAVRDQLDLLLESTDEFCQGSTAVAYAEGAVVNAYRLVHFSPSPWNGLRWPMGALILRNDDLVVVLTPMVPDEATIGGPASAALLRMVSKRLQAAESIDALCESMGPHVSLDAIRYFPESIDNISDFVLATLPGGESYKPRSQDASADKGEPLSKTEEFGNGWRVHGASDGWKGTDSRRRP